MIIKNVFSNGGEDNNRQARTNAKFCTICQSAFQKEKDDIRLAHCHDCVSNNRTADAAHWKQVFANQKANSLPPNMALLAEKLAKNRTLIEGKKIERAAGQTDGSQRNLNEIRKTQASLNQVDFTVVKAQVRELLPSILGELGLTKKVNAELLVDLIVPIKIASPIVDSLAGRSALKSIVHEALAHVNVTREMSREAAVKPHGIVNTDTSKYHILNEGYGRVSNNYGDRSRSLQKIAEGSNGQMNLMPGEDMHDNAGLPGDGAGIPAPQSQFAPAQADDMNGGMDPMAETGPSADVAGSVTKLDDAQADAIINEPPSTQGPGAPEPQMPNEGVGTYSGGNENMVPDASEMDMMPQEGIKRVDQSAPDNMSRQVANLRNKKPTKIARNIFSFAGRVSGKPVESVRLSQLDRNIIENHPPINKLAAVFSDNSRLAWNYYLTDKGYLMVSPENSFHSSTLSAFADFVELDSTFTKWASLPEELQDTIPSVLNDNHEVSDMALPEIAQPSIPGGEGTPGFNDVPETELNPSQNNVMGPGGLMNDQDAIFNNSGDTSNPAQVETSDNDVLDTASDMLPHIEKMFPDDTPDEHYEMAITAALELLTKKANAEPKTPMQVGEDTSTPEDITSNETIKKALKKNW